MVYPRLLCMILLLTLVIASASEGSSSAGGTPLLHRKIFWERKRAVFEKYVAENNGNAGRSESMVEDWELRRVPAGPDPLHHNGQDPNNPRTP